MGIYMYWPIGLAVLAEVMYQISSKSTPQDLNPFASLTITYLIGAAVHRRADKRPGRLAPFAVLVNERDLRVGRPRQRVHRLFHLAERPLSENPDKPMSDLTGKL